LNLDLKALKDNHKIIADLTIKYAIPSINNIKWWWKLYELNIPKNFILITSEYIYSYFAYIK
jgi:hypothetical protein